MSDAGPYTTPASVEAAIKDAASTAAGADPSLTVNERIRLEYFNRFLSRVFSDATDSQWLLKGGTGMLARVPSTRSTLDIDLFRNGFTLDQALVDLRRLAGINLSDHFRFVYVGHETSIGGEEQPYTDGYRVAFDVYIGAKKKSTLHVDLASGAGITAPVTTTEPASALPLPRLISNGYRLYPVVDQIADKVCATMMTYRGRPSSRQKDLVDLVVLAVTQDVDCTSLAIAISTEARRRRMEPFERFTVPSEWGTGYAKLAWSVPHCADFRTAELARTLVAVFIDPALDANAATKMWSHQTRSWS